MISLLAQRSLFRHVRAGGRGAAGEAGSRPGGRRWRTSSAATCARSTTTASPAPPSSSCAENFSDAVVAPAFWYVLFGLPGMLVYKAVNTMDSMVGYRSERYLRLRLGGGAARRRGQSDPGAARRPVPGRRGVRRARRGPRARPADDDRGRRQAPLAERRLAGGGDGRRAGAVAGGSEALSRPRRRRPVDRRRHRAGDGARRDAGARRCSPPRARSTGSRWRRSPSRGWLEREEDERVHSGHRQQELLVLVVAAVAGDEDGRRRRSRRWSSRCTRTTTAAEIARHSPGGKVPVLRHGELVVWESIAILEYLAEVFPEARLWPRQRRRAPSPAPSRPRCTPASRRCAPTCR